MPKRTGRPPGRTLDGPKIRQMRTDQGLTAMDVAIKVRCDPESVRRAERGGRVSDVFTVRLAKALGVAVEEIASPSVAA